MKNPIKRILILIFFCGVAQFLFFPVPDLPAVDWQEVKGQHFIVYFTGEEQLAKDILDKAEIYYSRIAADLGYPRYSDFWLWENRVKIYIYTDRDSFLKATGQPDWSEGMADYNSKQIISYRWSKGFLDSLLPHEMAHLIFRDFVGFKGEVPLWLDEGVAQWEEEAKRQEMKSMVKQLLDKDGLLALSDMMNLDLRRLKQTDKVYFRTGLTKDGKKAVVVLSTVNLVNTYYVQSVSLVGFLIERYGGNNFASFCRELREGKTVEGALIAAYPDHFRSLDDLEQKWRQYVIETY